MMLSPRAAGALCRALATAAIGLSLLAIDAAAAEYHRFAEPDAWVDVAEPEYDAPLPAGGGSGGAFAVLLDRQLRATSGGDAHYGHVAFKITDSVGVEDFSHFDLPVDPTFQALDIHRLRVVRNGTVIDQRAIARISELPQESDLEFRIYNGRYNVNVLLADVRVGDVVEYSYTLRSKNLVFSNHFAARLDTAWSMPVRRHRIRVVAPLDRPIRFRASDSTPLPEPVVRDGARELVREWRDVPARAAEPAIPAWYEAWPYIEASDLASWQDVAGLVSSLYEPPARPGPGVAAVIAAIRAAGGSRDEQILRALQYVQGELRYTSLSIGRGSFVPTDSELVLERRFGDCKDKSLLLTAILRGLGVDADVALVHSTRGRALDAVLPTPYAFDHAIVQVRDGGRTYWVDPTAAKQHAPLGSSYPADYERALVAAADSTRLAVIPQPEPGVLRKRVDVTFDVSSGFDEPALLDIVTRYEGLLADTMRPWLARGNADQRQTDYEAYIARYYPSARSRAPLEVVDDPERTVLEVRERYRLEQAFAAADDGSRELVLHPDELYGYAEPLGAGARKAPLALEYPIRVLQNITVHLPEEWSITPERLDVENPAFRYSKEVGYAERTLRLGYRYEALTDHVELEAVPRFESDRARAYDDMGYLLTYDPTALSGNIGLAPVPLFVVLSALGLAIWAAVRCYRYDPAPREAPANAPVGLGGWLVLPGIGVFLGPFVMAAVFFAWVPFMDVDMWRSLPRIVSDDYRAMAYYVVPAIIALAAALTVGTVLLAVLYFKKRSSFPSVYIALKAASLVYVVAVLVWDYLAVLETETSLPEITAIVMRDGFLFVAWTAYMLSSRRVAATFVRRYRRRDAVTASPTVDTAALVS